MTKEFFSLVNAQKPELCRSIMRIFVKQNSEKRSSHKL